MVGGTLVLTPIFRALGSFEPVWADAWIFMGSLLATYGMAKGWTEFWLIWVAVDIVGVPLLVSAGYYASALLYVFYGAFTIFGFITWMRVQRVYQPDGTRSSTDHTAELSSGWSSAISRSSSNSKRAASPSRAAGW